MEQVMEVFRRDDAEKRIPVLRMEIDYELLNLHEALLDEDLPRIEECKQKLGELRKEMLRLEAYAFAK
jgi:uncharacterized small protein (DUF1192 family)